MCGFIGQIYSEPLRCFEGLYKQVGIRSQVWGGGCLSTDLLGNLEQVVSPLLVCLFIGKRRFLAQVGAEVPCEGQALWIGTRPRAPTPILAGQPPPHPGGPLRLLVPRQEINKQAEVISLFLGNKAGVVWRGVCRESQECQVERGQGGLEDHFPAGQGTSEDTQARCVDFALSLV